MQAVIAANVPTGVRNSVKNSSLSIDPSIYARIAANEIFLTFDSYFPRHIQQKACINQDQLTLR